MYVFFHYPFKLEAKRLADGQETPAQTIFHIITLLLLTRVSEWLNQRAFIAVLQSVWTLPCIIALRFWPGVIKDAWGTYALITVLLSYPYCHAINVAWVSKNANNVGTRTVASALYNVGILFLIFFHSSSFPRSLFPVLSPTLPMMHPLYLLTNASIIQISVQIGHVIYSFIYVEHDKPYYRDGNTKLLAINILSIFLFFFTKAYYVWRNKQKDATWRAMSEAERADYVQNSPETGCKRLDFRFAH
jgi:hypothetical protein